MTNAKVEIQDGAREALLSLLSLAYLLATVLYGVILSGETADMMLSGMELAVRSVIPSSFPFMIISDLYVSYGSPERIAPLRKFAARVLGIPPSALGAMVCGNVGGFPIGARLTAELYRNGEIDATSAHRLTALSSNPSVAFVIGAVGLGMYSDIRVGIILLMSLYISTCLCALITKSNACDFIYSNDNARQNYSFVASVKNAGMSCIGVISFISIFSVAIGLIKNHLPSRMLSYIVTAFLEVTSAANAFSDSAVFPLTPSLALTAFSLGFGGICVMMQNAVFTEGCGIGLKNYIPIKLLEGAICSALASVLSLIII